MAESRSTAGSSRHTAPTQRSAVLAIALLSIIALVALACGGGGSSSPAASRAPGGSTGTGGSGAVSSTNTGGSSARPSTGTGGSGAVASSGTESAEPSSETSAEPGGESAAPSAGGESAAPGGETPLPSAPQPTPAQLEEGGPDIATTITPPDAGADIEIWTHFTGPDGAYFAGLVDKFNTEQQQCRATMRVQLGSVFNQQVVAAAVGNQLPEILVGGYDRIPFLASEGVLTDVSDVVDQAGFSADKFPEAIWNAGEYDGVRYSVPLDTHPAVFFYNKALFEQAGLDPANPPADKAAFEAAIQAIDEKTDATGYQMVGSGAGAIFLTGLQFATLFYQGGGEWTNADYTEATFNSQAGVQAADYLRSLVANLGVPLVESDTEIAAFAAGENAMVLSGVWESTRYASALGEDLGIGRFPSIFGEGQWAGSHQMMLTTASQANNDVRQCSAYFMDWLSANSYNWGQAGQVPARNEVRDAILNADPATLGQTLQIIQQVAPLAETVKFLPTIPSGGDLLFLAGGAGEAAVLSVNGTKTPQQALDDAATFFTERLQQDKQTYGY